MLGNRLLQIRLRFDVAPARGGNLELLEELLFEHAILRGGERIDRRADERFVRQRAQRIDGDVLPIEGEHLGVARELAEQLRVRELADDLRRHLAGRRALRRIEEQEVEAERIARQREHAAELAGAHDADGHCAGVTAGSGFCSTDVGLLARGTCRAPCRLPG